MTSFNHIRFADGSEFSLAEWLGQPRFSTCEFANTAGLSGLRAFNYVKGQPVSSIGLPQRNATAQDTNQVKAGQMNQDEAMLCFSITVAVYGLNTISGNNLTITPAPLLSGSDLRRLERDCLLELFVGAGIKKPQFEAPLVYYGQSVGATVVSSGDTGGTAAIATDYGTMGHVTGTNQNMFDLPVYIGGFGDQARPGNSMVFFTKLYNAFGGPVVGLRQSVRVVIELDGLSKRPA